jgi:ribosomal protein S18 acetylase RimI-like enzyme
MNVRRQLTPEPAKIRNARMVDIYPARFPEQLEVVRAIFREYAESLGVDLSFQNFESELAELPGKFAAPRGCVLLAQNNEDMVGCVAMRPLDESTCEMKRLYIRPAGRGQQVGRQLATRICRIAQEAGYTRIRLDTLPDMRAAQRLYASLGFEPIAAYVFNPIAGTIFLERNLTGPEIQAT